MIPSGVSSLISSLYFSKAPSFLQNSNFPAIGYPNTTKTSTIPALLRSKNAKKTVDYTFDVDLGPKFNQMIVRKIDLGILVTWQTNLVSECEQYTVHRQEDNKESKQIAVVKCDNSSGALYNHKDYHYNTKSTFVKYYVIYHDFFGEEVASNEVQIQLNGGNVSVRSDGRGRLFFPREVTTCKVLDLNGILVHSQLVSNKVEELPSHIKNGVYVVEYSGNRIYNRSKIQVVR